ncbi:hypothetical protein MOR12E_19325 [Methylobacterium oryzae]
MAQDFINSMIETKRMPASADLAYTMQSVGAWNALTGNLPDRRGMELFFAAFQNTSKAGAGGGS